MGESSACLVRSLSLSSPTSSDGEKGNYLQRALTSSVSFGRFVTESLDWEKWSAFTHNQYLEEVGRYSKPGSVAEKKAYFEAHFKRRRAEALQNAEVNNPPEINEKISVKDNSSSSDLDSAQRDSYGKDGDIQNINPLSSLVGQSEFNDASRETNSETDPSGESEEVSESAITMENDSNDSSIITESETGPSGEFEEVSEPLINATEEIQQELTNILEKDECNGDDIVSKKEDKACNEDDSNRRNPASLPEKKSRVSSSSKLSTNGGIPKCAPPVKRIMPSQIRNSVKIPNVKNIDTMNSSNKRRSYMTSLHMSINCAPSSHKAATSSGLPKVVANSRPVRAPAKKYKNSTIPQTSTKASVSGVSKHHSATLPAENRRTVTPHGDSKLASKAVDGKVHPQAENKRMVTPEGYTNSVGKTVDLKVHHTSEVTPEGYTNSVRKTLDWKVHQSSDFSKSTNTFEGKTRTPTSSSPFTFKSDERAAKRKEFFQMLEQKLKSKETEKNRRPAKPEVKSRSTFKSVHNNSIVSKATENAEVPPRREVSNNLNKKKNEEKTSFKVQDNDSRPPWGLSVKKTKGLKDVAGMNIRPSAKAFPKKANENVSPNIQV